tara:strand:- start:12707 stop:13486 length:780 start_codon:yes stop_codon:yes gene_type:complete
MKLGISYNVFDGEELLEASIKTIRDQADYISVIYQTVSNFGISCDEGLLPLLENLLEVGLVDELLHYKTPEKHCSINELEKRNVGVRLSRENGCTHHMSMDTDEFYLENEFTYLKESMIAGNYDSSACQTVIYYKNSEHRLEPHEIMYVSLINKIDNGQEFEFFKGYPLMVDPTRQMRPGNLKSFTRDEIEMHHMSHVRKNIRVKYENSSARQNFGNKIDGWVEHYENWVLQPDSRFPGNPKDYAIIKTDKLFDIGNCC